ncbi:hypothetical protein CEXT_600981 [Caerostris extrusa]|uniref:LAGLIDADG homing endonuclease n=1 Tax=Caerostris extrusa TaxID=172846 RepID=A0AAV4TCX9_CAEEX|nr:hypothetical protein CEXT_600981 [Caerostris extrusa]
MVTLHLLPNEKCKFIPLFFVHRSATRNIEAPRGYKIELVWPSPPCKICKPQTSFTKYTRYLRHNGKAPLDKFIRDCFRCAMIFKGLGVNRNEAYKKPNEYGLLPPYMYFRDAGGMMWAIVAAIQLLCSFSLD